jgi:hypothetical protein
MTILTGCDQNFTRLSEEEKERQIDDFIMGSVLDKPKNNDSKYSVLMVGLPGSGKTTACKKCIPDGERFDDFVIIDVDEIINRFLKNDIKCYMEAYTIFSKWIDYCIENGYNFILDGTGKNLDDIIIRLNKEEYRIILCINLVNIQTAKSRVQIRANISGRVVRPEYIDHVSSMLKNKIPEYINNDKIYDVYILSNENRFENICHGKEMCINKLEEINQFFKENIDTLKIGGKSRLRKSRRRTRRRYIHNKKRSINKKKITKSKKKY